MAQNTSIQIDETRMFPKGTNGFRKVSLPDDKADTGYSAVTVHETDITDNKDGTYIIAIDPGYDYKINRRVAKEDGSLGFEKDVAKGSMILAQNDKAMTKTEEAEAPAETKRPKDTEVFTPKVAEQQKKAKKAKTAAAGMAMGAAGTKALAGEKKAEPTFGSKIAKGAGFVAATAAASTVVGAMASQVKARKGFSNPLSEAVGQILMGGASPLERKIPPVGVVPDKKDREVGYDFDV